MDGSERKARLAELRNKRKNAVTQVGIELSQPDTKEEPGASIEENVEAPFEEQQSMETPTLRISENETVEAVASRIQEEIFERIYKEADTTQSNLEDKKSFTKDLEKDIELYVTRARLGTDKAINRIIREKYEQNFT